MVSIERVPGKDAVIALISLELPFSSVAWWTSARVWPLSALQTQLSFSLAAVGVWPLLFPLLK